MITNVIWASVRDGRLDLLVPPEWPDGAEVEVRRVGASTAEDGPPSSDEITRTLAAMDAVVPFELGEDERAAADADRVARRNWEIARSDQRAADVSRGWE